MVETGLRTVARTAMVLLFNNMAAGNNGLLGGRNGG
jgi:hypothetical protein